MTASRLRNSVATYFDVCCEVYGDKPSGEAFKILYPPEYNDESTLSSLKQFCFPTGNERDDSEAVQLFTFVLTDAQSQYTFGYCRYTPLTHVCLCVLSGLTWTTHFYKFLNHVSNVMNNGVGSDLELLLTNAYHIDIPGPGQKLKLNACTEIGKFTADVPDTNKLPTLRSDKFMLEFYNAVSEKQMITLFASLLKERRIIFTGRKLSQLSSCAFALSKLLYPFYWQNLFIPILPADLVDMLMAPMPYIIGVPKSTFRSLNKPEFGEIVVVDLDKKTYESPNVDLLPTDVFSFLRTQLKSSSEMFLSDSLARSFLRTNVLIFGKYSLGLVKNESDGLYSWDRELFVRNQRLSIQPFLNSLISKDGVQYFERFAEERLAMLNAGQRIFDEFEKEIVAMDPKRFMDRNNILQTKPPEVISQAVNNMRENASDVIIALKDRVQAISVKDRLGKFNPREVRRHKIKTSRKKKSLDPLSLDAAHYSLDAMALEDNANNLETVSDAESVSSTGDLIDLSEDNSAVKICNNGNSASTPSLAQAPSNLNDDDLFKNLFSPNFPTIATATTSTVNAHLSANAMPKRTNWETFE